MGATGKVTAAASYGATRSAADPLAPYSAAAAPLVKTYATWNPADKDAAYTLSGDDLIVERTGATGWTSLRANQGKATGKWYFEYSRYLTNSPYIVVGVMDATGTLSGFVGSDTHGIGYYGQTGQKTYNGSLSAYGTAYDAEIVGVAFDATNRTVEFFSNNVSQGQIDLSALGLTGALYPALAVNAQSMMTITNFGASALTYTPPTGFNSGVYTEA